MEPGIEPVRIAETGQVAPGADERFLDRVARELRVAEDEPGCRVQPRETPVDQQGEGVMIASLCSCDGFSLVQFQRGLVSLISLAFSAATSLSI